MIDYDKTCNEIIQAYCDLLIVQYFNKPKARETIKVLMQALWADCILWKVRDLCLNVDKSVGVQLDQIGQWVGLDRYIKRGRYEGKLWYAYIDWDDESEPNSLQGGLQDWSDKEELTDGPFLDYAELISTRRKLNDETFRILIKLKIIKNEIRHSPKFIDDALYELFGLDVFVEWGECLQMTYNYKPNKTSIMELALEKNVLPCPTGTYLKMKELDYGEVA